MNHVRSTIGVVLLGVLVFLALPRTAHAYLDPGTGSYLLQLLIAGLVGAVFAIKIFWGRISAYLRRLFSHDEDAALERPSER